MKLPCLGAIAWRTLFFIAMHPFLTVPQIATCQRRTHGAAYKTVAELEHAGLVERVSIAGFSGWRYRVTKSGGHQVLPPMNLTAYFNFIGLTGRPLDDRLRSWTHDLGLIAWLVECSTQTDDLIWIGPPWPLWVVQESKEAFHVIFDAIVVIRASEGMARVWAVEYNRGTRRISSLSRQMSNYAALLAQARGQFSGLLVLADDHKGLNISRRGWLAGLNLPCRKGVTEAQAPVALFGLRHPVSLGSSYSTADEVGGFSPLSASEPRRLMQVNAYEGRLKIEDFSAGSMPWKARAC